jgi:hypothetical protein
MEPEGSLPHSQEAATCPYPEHFYLIWTKISIFHLIVVEYPHVDFHKNPYIGFADRETWRR